MSGCKSRCRSDLYQRRKTVKIQYRSPTLSRAEDRLCVIAIKVTRLVMRPVSRQCRKSSATGSLPGSSFLQMLRDDHHRTGQRDGSTNDFSECLHATLQQRSESSWCRVCTCRGFDNIHPRDRDGPQVAEVKPGLRLPSSEYNWGRSSARTSAGPCSAPRGCR